MKDGLFNKLVKKDFNNSLEKVLSKKDFSKDVKNSLLSMFYKIENGYNDYSKIKKDTLEKNEYIEKLIEIIDKECNIIEFTTNKSQEKIDRKNKKIVCFPNEIKLLYGLAKLNENNIEVNYLDENIEKAFSFLLNYGHIINFVEPLRDFNGFSWNIIVKDIENVFCNLIYQNLLFLVGNEFVEKWINNVDFQVDYFNLLKIELEKKYGKSIEDKIINKIIKLSIIIKANYNSKFKEKVLKDKQKLEQQKAEMENKEKFLSEISKQKKQKEKEIKKIDTIINDKELLIKEYKKRNEKVSVENKIFSVNVLKKHLKIERKQLLNEIKELNDIINPSRFNKNLKNIEKMLNFFDIFDEKLNINIYLIELQKDIIECMKKSVENTQDKAKIIDLIYYFRYYSYLPLNKNQTIIEIKELQKSLNELSISLINKALKLKVINQICKEDNLNNNILQKLFLSKIISLQDINVKLLVKNDETFLKVLDENVEDEIINLGNIEKENVKIKLNKSIKLFI